MKAKRIVLVSLFDLTKILHRMATCLERAGHEVFWITTSQTWHNWLLEQGVESVRMQKLLYTPDDYVSAEEKAELTPEIVRSEAAADLSFNQMLLMDRFVLYHHPHDADEFVYLYYRDIKHFLKVHDIDIVFCEPTNLNELITHVICRELGIRMIAPWDMRYPTGRVVFTEGYLQDTLVATGRDLDPDAGREFIRGFRENRQRPTYFDHQNRQPVTTFGKLLRSFKRRVKRGELTNPPNLTHHSVVERARLILRRIVNGYYLRHLATYDQLSAVTGRYAFFGLHVQPEASIDVRGSYFSDQIKLIKDIRRALPFDTALVVKEHPNFLGIRGRSFFQQLRAIPNIKVVKHDVSTFDILENCDVVFTVSGTIAYEAGLLGKAAITFSPVYFDKLSSVHYCGEITELKALLTRIRQDDPHHLEADCRVMGELLADSFEGSWADPYNYPGVMADDNIEKLEAAFLHIVEHVDH